MRTSASVFLIFSLAIVSNLSSQMWQSTGGGTNAFVRALHTDPSTGQMYVAGNFTEAGGVTRYQIATWDGQEWGSLGVGTGDTNCYWGCNPLTSIAKYEGDVFVGGHNGIMGGVYGRNFLNRWNGVEWDSCGNPNALLMVEAANNNLFALGWFDSISNHPAWKVAQWNGMYWEKFADSLPVSDDAQLSTVAHYQGQYYFGGNFHTSTVHEILAWNGDEWSNLDGGIGGDSWVSKLCVYKDLLFVGGEFSQFSGNAASYLMAWDGSRWLNPFPEVRFGGQVTDLQVIDGVLYIVGAHQVFDGSGWQGYYRVAKYDGVNFCSFGGTNLTALCIAGLKGDIYIATIKTIGGDTVNYCARWMGGDTVDYCVYQPVGIHEPRVVLNSLKLFPNPTSDRFRLTLPSHTAKVSLCMRDMTGRMVLPPWEYKGGEVDVSTMASGVYLLEVAWRDWRAMVKLVKEY